MPSIQLIITDAGRAALVNAQHNGTNAVTIAQMGVSGTPIVAAAATTNLPNEVKRIATISGSAVAADTMHVVVRDESADVFTVRSFAFYLSDGTLFAAYGQAGVIAEKSAQAMLLFAVDVIFADINAAMLTFGNANFLNPPATIDTAGVVKLATDAEAVAMANAIKALTPRGMALAFTAANVLARLLAVDGSGSGLDADLLDGQDGSYYTNITARLGYTPLNALTYTASDILGKLVTVDGAGSGLDADLLDGQDSSYYANIVARLGYTPLNALAYTASDILGKLVTVDGSGTGLDADLLDGRQAAEFALLSGASFTGPISAANLVSSTGGSAGFTFTDRANGDNWVVYASGGVANFYVNGGNRVSITASGGVSAAGAITSAGSIVWNAGNDGSGSGLDADLLDGQEGSYYANIAARLGYAPANKAGDTFTGAVSIANELSVYYAGGASGALYLNQAKTRYLYFDGAKYILATAPLKVDGNVAIGGEPGTYKLEVTGTVNATGAITRAGNKVWDAANDGSGSGLDADLLDGREASEFALLAGATFSGNFGRDANYLLTLPTGNYPTVQFDPNDFLTYDRGTNAFQFYIGGALRHQVGGSSSDFSGTLTINGSLAWSAANDGSGSGLDADLLDGLHASAFALLTDATRAGSNAYGYWEKRPNGVIEQWGTLNANYTEGQIAITFPIAFTDVDSINVTAIAVNSASSDKYDISIQRVSKTVNGCVVFAQYSAAASSINQINGVDWRAVGR